MTKITGKTIDPGTPLRVMVELGPARPSWIACFIDPAGPAAGCDRVLLVGPPVGRQRVK